MDEITVETAPQKLRDMFNKGFVALERGNLEYAIDLFSSCVAQEPRFLNARRFLRAAEIKLLKGRGQSALAGVGNLLSGLPTIVLIHTHMRSKPLEALHAMEKLLRRDPLNKTFLHLFGRVAVAADMPEVAIQTLAMAREHFPEDDRLLEWLGDLYLVTHQTGQARECFEKVCELRPNDGTALKKLKDSMALHSMAKDGWSEAAGKGRDGYRAIIRDEKEAQLLEKESKAVKAASDIDALVAEYQEKIKKEPENVNYRRALANLYASNQMFTEALQALEETRAIISGRDPQVDNTIAAVRLQQFDHEIERLRKGGQTQEAESQQKERNTFAFNSLQDRVTRYPNEPQLRYEFGVMLAERNLLNEAIQQFQLSQRNPQYRVRSFHYLGICFAGKEQFDMAIEQLEKAVAELPTIDDLKKDVLYELGKAREAHGDHAAALECFKQIYQADIAYKDVATRIEKGYDGTPKA